MITKMYWDWWVEGPRTDRVADIVSKLVGNDHAVSDRIELLQQIGTVVYSVSRFNFVVF